MQRLVGFENAKVMTGESTQLPKGGYIVKIMDCQEISGEKNGKRYSYLAFSFDVCEGEYKNHFTNLYTASTDENKKWRGVLNVFVPQEGDVYYEDNLSRFKTMTANFEESNKGYAWNWDEKTLKNKVIGIIYGEKEFLTNDNEVIIITEPKYFTSVERIREGKFKIPAIKKLNRPAMTSSVASGFDAFTTDDSNEKLPWEL